MHPSIGREGRIVPEEVPEQRRQVEVGTHAQHLERERSTEGPIGQVACAGHEAPPELMALSSLELICLASRGESVCLDSFAVRRGGVHAHDAMTAALQAERARQFALSRCSFGRDAGARDRLPAAGVTVSNLRRDRNQYPRQLCAREAGAWQRGQPAGGSLSQHG